MRSVVWNMPLAAMSFRKFHWMVGVVMNRLHRFVEGQQRGRGS
ncbi:hypothetical protein ACFPRL_20570 [Pseudoclavibacter helvolus]